MPSKHDDGELFERLEIRLSNFEDFKGVDDGRSLTFIFFLSLHQHFWPKLLKINPFGSP